MKYNNKIYLTSVCILLYFFFCVSNVHADYAEVFPDRLVTFRSSASLEEHIQTLKLKGPHLVAIAEVTGIESPKCDTPPEGPAIRGDTTYCDLQVMKVEDLFFVENPKSPKNKFVIHYWYPKNKIFEIKKGEHLVVFLTLSHFQNVYVVTMILRATDEVVAETREVLRKMRINDKP